MSTQKLAQAISDLAVIGRLSPNAVEFIGRALSDSYDEIEADTKELVDALQRAHSVALQAINDHITEVKKELMAHISDLDSQLDEYKEKVDKILARKPQGAAKK